MQILNHKKGNQMISLFLDVSIMISQSFLWTSLLYKSSTTIFWSFHTYFMNKFMWFLFKTNISIKMQFFGKNTDTEYWYFSFFLVLILIMFSVFFMVNTDIDTSVFKICTEYWILVLLFCTGHFSDITWHSGSQLHYDC